MRRLRACGSAELGQVASGSATQYLWLGNRKVGSQVVGKDRNQLPGKGTVRKLAEEEHEEKEPATEPRRKYTDLESDVGERDEHVVCYARRGMPGSEDVSLTAFITSMSGSEILMSLVYRFVHFRRTPGLRMAYDVAENE